MRIGIDLGGTKIEAVALSPAGEEIARRRVTTPRDYAASLDAIAGLVRELDRAADDTGTVGVGIPGTVVPQTGLVKNANSVWLNGRPLGRDLEERLDRPVPLMDDANCFALSEASDGRSEEHTSELQSQSNLVCRLLLEKKKNPTPRTATATINR